MARKRPPTDAVTNSHEASHPLPTGRLTMEQLNAIDLLIQGKADHDVAATVGVARETVTRWRGDNPYFVAELNRARKELWGTAHDRLRGLVHTAVDILEKALNAGELRAAIEVLKAVRLYGAVPTPDGLDDPELVLVEYAREWAAAEVQRQGPVYDPLEALLHADAMKQTELTQQRLATLRQQWGSEGSEDGSDI